MPLKQNQAAAVEQKLSDYTVFQDEVASRDQNGQAENYADMVNAYYDLATDFYEYGWGDSFHFGVRAKGESLRESILRHEYYLAHMLSLRPGMRALDVGCGVGGPMRNIARFSGANVVGLNNNKYQIGRGQQHTKDANLEDLCSFVHGDFMQMPFEDETFDACYAIEATCHAPNRLGVYSEVFRCLAPGGEFVGYEWCLTDHYRDDNSEHQEIKRDIEYGDGLPELINTRKVDEALKESGFEMVESRDVASECSLETPWYLPLDGSLSISGFRHTRLGSKLTHLGVRALEAAKIAPAGSSEVSSMLMRAARGLVDGGKLNVFTPMYFFKVRKPK